MKRDKMIKKFIKRRYLAQRILFLGKTELCDMTIVYQVYIKLMSKS